MPETQATATNQQVEGDEVLTESPAPAMMVPDEGPESEAELDEIAELQMRLEEAKAKKRAKLTHTLDDTVHELDLAPVNSKIVVVLDGIIRKAILATPDGEKVLPETDRAHKLPQGARIRKLAEGKYFSEQVDPAEDRPAKTYTTAVEAIADFVQHFHEPL